MTESLSVRVRHAPSLSPPVRTTCERYTTRPVISSPEPELRTKGSGVALGLAGCRLQSAALSSRVARGGRRNVAPFRRVSGDVGKRGHPDRRVDPGFEAGRDQAVNLSPDPLDPLPCRHLARLTCDAQQIREFSSGRFQEIEVDERRRLRKASAQRRQCIAEIEHRGTFNQRLWHRSFSAASVFDPFSLTGHPFDPGQSAAHDSILSPIQPSRPPLKLSISGDSGLVLSDRENPGAVVASVGMRRTHLDGCAGTARRRPPSHKAVRGPGRRTASRRHYAGNCYAGETARLMPSSTFHIHMKVSQLKNRGPPVAGSER